MAKLHLGLINPGEEVIVIPEPIDLSQIILEEEKEKRTAKIATLTPLEKWFRFFFEDNPWKNGEN